MKYSRTIAILGDRAIGQSMVDEDEDSNLDWAMGDLSQEFAI